MSQKKNQNTQEIVQIDKSWMKSDTPIWIDVLGNSGEMEAYKKGIILQLEGNNVKVKNIQKGSIAVVQVSQIYQMNSEEILHDDMVDMEILNEAELLNNIHKRFLQSKIFTYVGPTLMSVNPYRKIPELFTQELIQSIQAAAFHVSFDKSQYMPHVYAIGCEAYRQLLNNQKKQAICISGESGAGKTENAKMAMNYLTSLSQRGETSPKHNQISIEDKILSCNPILEAFGNAKTVRNDNSSRFGKYVQLIVNQQEKKIIGANTLNYLLEKSRVTTLGEEERNYHIFYFLCKGANQNDLKNYCMLNDGEKCNLTKFNILNRSTCYNVNVIDDVALYQEVKESFQTMNFSVQEEEAVWKIVSAILHLGNIEIDDSQFEKVGSCQINDEETLGKVAEMLQIEQMELKMGLLKKSRKTPSGIIKTPLNKNDSIIQRDSFMKDLYDKLFCWLVRRLNQTILPQEYIDKQIRNKEQVDEGTSSIGLLDIFGFEVFKLNSLEQFCINYTNEKLHQLYIQYMFKSETKEFEVEGLGQYLNQEIKFNDNQDIIDLLESQQGIFPLLDQICQTRGDDSVFFQTISKSHEGNKYFTKPKMSRDTFTIIHTAKNVDYSTNGFTFKNRDELDLGLEELIKNSKHQFIPLIYQNLLYGENPVSDESSSNSSNSKGSSVPKVKFIGAKFRNQMKDLMNELFSCDVHFIRCIKPNEKKIGTLFHLQFALTQIRYLGVLDSIRVRRETYPVRKLYLNFYERYIHLDNRPPILTFKKHLENKTDFREKSIQICQEYLSEYNTSYILYGKTKIYMQSVALNKLEEKFEIALKDKHVAASQIQQKFFHFIKRQLIHSMSIKFGTLFTKVKNRIQRKQFIQYKYSVMCVQKWWRNVLKKRIQAQLNDAAIVIQKMVRGYLVRRNIAQLIYSVSIIENAYCKYRARTKLNNVIFCKQFIKIAIHNTWNIISRNTVLDAVSFIQRYWRGYLVRKLHHQKVVRIQQVKKNTREKIAAILIQKNVKGFLIRKKYRCLRRTTIFLQCYFRTKWLSSIFQQLRWSAVVIQRAWRSYDITKKIVKARQLVYLKNEIQQYEKVRKLDNQILFSEVYVEQQQQTGAESIPQNKTNPRKMNLVSYIIDIEHLADSSEIYQVPWSETYQSVYRHQMQSKQEIQVVEVGETHTVCVSIQGRVYSWGWNDNFQLGDNINNNNNNSDVVVSPQMLESIRVRVISCGDEHTAILDDNNQLYIWGSNTKGQHGLGYTLPIKQIIYYDAFGKDINIVDVKCKKDQTYVVTESGQVFMWPSKNTNTNTNNNFFPMEIPFPEDIYISRISCGNQFVIFLSQNGLVFSQGENDQGQLGQGDNIIRGEPTLVTQLKETGERIIHLSCGFKHVTCYSSLGKIFLWGWGAEGQLGTGHTSNLLLPCHLDLKEFIQSQKILMIQASFRSTVILTEKKSVFWWGTNGTIHKQLLPCELKYTLKVPSLRDTKDVIPVRVITSWSKVLSVCQVTFVDTRHTQVDYSTKQKVIQKINQMWQESLNTVNPPFSDAVSKYFYSKCMRFKKKDIEYNSRQKTKSQPRIKVDLTQSKQYQSKERISNNSIASSSQRENNFGEPEEWQNPQQQQYSTNSYEVSNRQISPEKYNESLDASFGEPEETHQNNYQQQQIIKEEKIQENSQNKNLQSNSDSNKPMQDKLREIKNKIDKIQAKQKNQWTQEEEQFMLLVSNPKVKSMIAKLDNQR